MRNPRSISLTSIILAAAAHAALIPDVETKCPLCRGFGCVDDDPEVPGSKVGCNNCHGKGFIPGRVVPSKSGGADGRD